MQPRYPWDGSNRDYSYDELITRFKSILYANNPLLAGNRKRTVLEASQVLREGTKKTVYVNFIDTCKMIHRQPEHVMTFFSRGNGNHWCPGWTITSGCQGKIQS